MKKIKAWTKGTPSEEMATEKIDMISKLINKRKKLK